MVEDKSSKITTRLSGKKWILLAAGLVVLFSVALIVVIILYGVLAGDPRGESIFPGP